MFIYIIKIFSLLFFLLSLIFLSFKIEKFYSIKKSKHTQVLDITKIDKNSSIVILKVGQEGVLLGVTPSNINKIKDISKDEIINIEKDIQKGRDDFDKRINHVINRIKQKKEGL